jgi:hypothetical protein
MAEEDWHESEPAGFSFAPILFAILLKCFALSDMSESS